MTLAVGRTFSTNKQSNKQKETKKNTQFHYDVLRDNKYGNGLWVTFYWIWSPKTGARDQKKKKHVIVVSDYIKSIKYRQKIDSSKKFQHNKCFESNNLCIYVHK